MTPPMIFLVQALVLVALPTVVLRLSGLKGVIPLVAVQIAIGIALGPSLLGRVTPDVYETFFNPAALAPLSGIGSVAVVMFGLVTGLHFDASILRSGGRTTITVWFANIVVPMMLGCLSGLWILVRYPEELLVGISPGAFAMAIGICVAVTALPVLGAILREMNLLGTYIADLSLIIAGIKDLTLYAALALLLAAVAGAAQGDAGVFLRLLFIPVYLAAMIFVVRPLLDKLVTARMEDGEIRERALVLVGVATIASALAVEAMGLSNILGAFVAGAVMPNKLRKPILDQIQAPTLALLMPFFFMLAGLRTLIDPASSAFVEVFVITTVISVVGIVGGTAVAARLVGHPWRFAFGLGTLLQTKGLMEIVVLTILLDARVISANVFTALILMAVVCTAITMPLTRLVLGPQHGRRLADPQARGVERDAGIGVVDPARVREEPRDS